MASVSNGDAVRITAKMSFANIGDIINVYHVTCEMTSDSDDATFMADVTAEIDAAYALIVGYIADELTFDSLEFYNITDDRPMGEVDWTTLVAGTDTTNQPMSAQMAAQVNFLTGVKRSQGRKYIGGLTELVNTGGGGVDGTFKGDLEDYGTQFMGNIPVTNGTVAFGHFDATGTNFRRWTGRIVPNLLATQRRRKLGTGS